MDAPKRKRKRGGDSSCSCSSSRPLLVHIFPRMLAASANIHTLYAQSLIKSLLKMHLSLITETSLALSRVLPNTLLCLLPLLLNPNRPKIAAKSAEIVGAAALCSFEANQRIATEKEIIDGLMALLTSGTKRLAMAAVNAILDLSTTSIGREKLQESTAVEKLLSLFCQLARSRVESVSHCSMDKGKNTCFKVGLMEDSLTVLVLEAVVTLVNTCTADYLAKIQGEQANSFLLYLKELWAKFQNPILQSKDSDSCQERSGSCSRIEKPDLAEAIFRLSMNCDQCRTWTFDSIKRSIFGCSDFEHFMLHYWEDKPFLLRRASNTLKDEGDIFNPLFLSFSSKIIDVIIDIIFGGLVSCPPIASDELDIFNFLIEVKGRLGRPITYGQDLRAVKTVELIAGSSKGNLKKEIHYFKDHMDSSNMEGSQSTEICHLQKLKEAYKLGYTVALRGMEFRDEKIASIADGLAMLTGQPSVGANVYLTPPRSQGLAQHYDDHCVFVCQLLGKKQWAISPQSSALLPRLYEPLNMVDLKGSDAIFEGKEFFLEEGDILYIPRGCPHEAHTVTCDNESQTDESTRCSLHLTLGIEVEPPFEWEGFAHVALHCWSQSALHSIVPRLPCTLSVTSVHLLHVAIRLIGDREPNFRKACMVSASFLQVHEESEHYMHMLDEKQRATFIYILHRINVDCRFLDAFNTVQVAVREKDDNLFQWMRWLQHLPRNGDANENGDIDNPMKIFEDLVLLYNGYGVEVEDAFMQVKSEFCKSTTFEDACKSYVVLLQKYKRTRKQYMNGMLSLHCTK